MLTACESTEVLKVYAPIEYYVTDDKPPQSSAVADAASPSPPPAAAAVVVEKRARKRQLVWFLLRFLLLIEKCFIIKNKKTYRHLHHHHRNLCNLVHVPVFFSYKKFTYFRCRKHIVMKSVSKFIMDWYDFILFFVFKILNKQFRNDLSQYRIKN